MKYIDIRYHRIKEFMDEGEVKMVKVHTLGNPADALTKVFLRDGFYKCMALMELMDRVELADAMEYQGGDCRIWCGARKLQRNKEASRTKKSEK